jgi:hypothetical protein
MSLSPGGPPEGTRSIPQSKTPTLLNADANGSDDNDPQPLEAPKFPPSHRRASSVDVNFFDPEGVDELERSLRRQSRSVHDLSLDTASTHTVSTIGIKDGKPFDLSKTLRKIVQKYASSLSHMPVSVLTVLAGGRRMTSNPGSSGWFSKIFVSWASVYQHRTQTRWVHC